MGRKRKYPEVSGYWVYSIKVPSINKYYIGVSGAKECSQRFIKLKYKGTALEPYLDEWDSMIKTVLVDNLTKEDAYKYEDNIIQALKMNDLCINKLRSGLFTIDENAYARELYHKNMLNEEFREEYNKKHREYYITNEEFRERKKKKDRERYHKNMQNEEFKEKERKRNRERYHKKKQQQNQTLLPL